MSVNKIDSDQSKVREQTSGGTLVYERKTEGVQELIGFESVEDWDEIRDECQKRGHGAGAIYHKPVLEAL